MWVKIWLTLTFVMRKRNECACAYELLVSCAVSPHSHVTRTQANSRHTKDPLFTTVCILQLFSKIVIISNLYYILYSNNFCHICLSYWIFKTHCKFNFHFYMIFLKLIIFCTPYSWPVSSKFLSIGYLFATQPN